MAVDCVKEKAWSNVVERHGKAGRGYKPRRRQRTQWGGGWGGHSLLVQHQSSARFPVCLLNPSVGMALSVYPRGQVGSRRVIEDRADCMDGSHDASLESGAEVVVATCCCRL